ncbi:glycosyltransferase [Bacteroides sp.]|uniref:glycosyltransferase n=1 Tax=Bacteroides sp. TaxID=29523 RepID=UPI002A80D69B|nr:glycosyltransferase [Bacteroides sp.]
MKILQTIPGLLASSGGPSTCTCDLMMGLHAMGASVDLLTVTCKNSKDYNLGTGSQWLYEVPNDSKTPLLLSKNLKCALEVSDYDIYHTNGMWMYSNHITCKMARAKKKPYIISPHGMLYPSALAIKRWKKWPMLRFWFNKDIHSATCLHATCMQEMEHCRTFGYKGSIAVIPNPVVFPEGVELATNKPSGRKQIGFLGRLHPIKKVENLIYALSILSKEEQSGLSLQIMGKYDDCYEEFLKAEVKRLGLEDCVEFVGFVSGKDKYDRLSRLWALMVPSTQENFGMIVPEALICGTPVYASLGTPWGELNECQCGWWKDNEPETIAKVMLEILSMSEAEVVAMGARGRKLMEEEYEQHKVAGMMNDLYRWVVGKCAKPDFVYTL